MLHGIRAEADGGYIASVESSPARRRHGEETPRPNSAVDCETGERQPIEPITWMREGGSRFIQRIGDRTFEAAGDAEGNADVFNESGVVDRRRRLRRLPHVRRGGQPGRLPRHGCQRRRPHLSPVRPGPGHHDRRVAVDRRARAAWRPAVVVRRPGARSHPDGTPGRLETGAIVIVDAATGEVVSTVPTTLDIAFVG